MKKIASLLLCLLLAVSTFAQKSSEKRIDEWVQYNRNKMKITYVYVSEAMVKVVDTNDLLQQFQINGNSLVDKLTSIQIVAVDNNPRNKNVWQYAASELVAKDFEKLLRLQNSETTTELYFHKEIKSVPGTLPAELLMVYEDAKTYKIIVFRGKFTLDDVVKSMKKRY